MNWPVRDLKNMLQPSSFLPDKWSIYLVTCTQEEDISAIRHYLAAEEEQQLAAYSYKKRRHEWLAGRLAVKHAINQFCGQELPLNEISIQNTAQGKPIVQMSGKQPNISISHSGGQAVGLVSWQPCGIDLQQITPALVRVRKRFVLPSEESLLGCLANDQSTALGLLWSAKEALRKAIPIWPLLGLLESAISNITLGENSIQLNMIPQENNRHLPTILPSVTVTMINQQQPTMKVVPRGQSGLRLNDFRINNAALAVTFMSDLCKI